MSSSKTAEKTDPKLWETVKREVTQDDKGGRPGQWSARKAQLATQEYQKAGGGYVGPKSKDNALQQWTDEDWGTKSGAPSTETGERYLPKRARDALSEDDYARTTRKKRADTRRGKQFSPQPSDIAEKTARFRGGSGATKRELYAEAARRNLPNRSRMTKAELLRALERP